MRTTHRHAWTVNPKAQVKQSKEGQRHFSHTDTLPLRISVARPGWCWEQKVIVTTLERVWYRDAVADITVPIGFTSDLASIPAPMWNIVSPYTLALEGLIHDQLYREQEVSRRYADFLLLQMMELRAVPFWIRYPVWAAVRLFGQRAWKQNAERKRRREARSAGSSQS